MPDKTRGSIDDHLRRGSFVNILETLKEEATEGPAGIHPEVDITITGMIDMLQKEETVNEVPGVSIAPRP
jgi:hypothetical protein